ncbi:MAG: amidase, partial [Gammaproteobacteria bacterium]|nr:amidase [Gammaproteobacteria bacterium]
MSAAAGLGMSLEQIAASISAGDFSVDEVVEAHLDALDTIGRDLNAVARIEFDDARRQAAALAKGADKQEGKGPLHGVPLAHKDLYYREGWRIEAGSRMLDGYVADKTAFACRQLDAAGALDLARLNTVEFGLGTTGHNVHTGPVKNPWNPDYITGGSSSGSAAAIAAGIVPAALGSDTGGSVRLPAAACGLVGIKPTSGLIGRSGVIPL